jgi:hypothetical protein
MRILTIVWEEIPCHGWQNAARSFIVGGLGNCLPLSNENKVRHRIYIQRTIGIEQSIYCIKRKNAYNYI